MIMIDILKTAFLSIIALKNKKTEKNINIINHQHINILYGISHSPTIAMRGSIIHRLRSLKEFPSDTP